MSDPTSTPTTQVTDTGLGGGLLGYATNAECIQACLKEIARLHGWLEIIRDEKAPASASAFLALDGPPVAATGVGRFGVNDMTDTHTTEAE